MNRLDDELLQYYETLLGLLLIIFLASAFAWGTAERNIQAYQEFLSGATAVEGVVVGFAPIDGSKFHFPRVEFKTQDGETRQAGLQIGRSYRAGEPIKLFYHLEPELAVAYGDQWWMVDRNRSTQHKLLFAMLACPLLGFGLRTRRRTLLDRA